MEFKHQPVMLKECIDALDIKSDGIYMDGTVGGGGHSYEIASKLNKNGTLIMFDLDEDAIGFAKERLRSFPCKKYFINKNFKEFYEEFQNLDLKADGILLDLGVSSYQIDNPKRGFSYMKDGDLLMSMDKNAKLTAYDVVNNYSERDLIKIFYEYGEEKFAKTIAKSIITIRKNSPIKTTFELVEAIEKAVPKSSHKTGHPAKRVFQAIRIEVNRELDGLKECLLDMVRRGLNANGRLCVLTFHSLEDRIVKEAFNLMNSDCICDKNLPICVCHHSKEIALLYKKPITPSESEMRLNPRAHSAKLRVACKQIE